MNLISLRWALRAAEYSNFRAAAKSLGVGQAALSRRVRSVEDEIGVSLFERHRDGVSVTIAGRAFLARVRATLDDLDYAAEAARAAGRAETGVLRIGLYHSLSSGRLRTLLADYRAKWSDVRLAFREVDSSEQMAALRERRLDIGFLVAVDETPGLEGERLWNEPAFAAMAEAHPLAAERAVTWDDLRTQEFVMRTHSIGLVAFGWLAERLKPGGVPANIRLHDVSRETLLGLVGAGFGMTVVTESAAGMTVPGVAYRPIEGLDAMIPIRMAWPADADNPALRRFVSHVRAGVASTSAVMSGPRRS